MGRLLPVLLAGTCGALACSSKQPIVGDEKLKAAITVGAWPEVRAEAASKTAANGVLGTHAEALRLALGHHRLVAKTRFSYRGEDGVEVEVNEVTRLTVASSGAFHVEVTRNTTRVDEPAMETGREGLWDGERFVSRLRFGSWTAHDPLRREHLEWHRGATTQVETFLALLGTRVTRKAQGRTVTLTAEGGVAPALPDGMNLDEARQRVDGAWFAWFGRVHRLDSVSGQLTLAPDADVVTAATIRFEARLKKHREPRKDLTTPEPKAPAPPMGVKVDDGLLSTPPQLPLVPHLAEATLSASLEVEVTRLETPPVITAPPKDEVRSPSRPRVQPMIESLVGTDEAR